MYGLKPVPFKIGGLIRGSLEQFSFYCALSNSSEVRFFLRKNRECYRGSVYISEGELLYCPVRMIGKVGVRAPAASSTVTPKPLACTFSGISGKTRAALP